MNRHCYGLITNRIGSTLANKLASYIVINTHIHKYETLWQNGTLDNREKKRAHTTFTEGGGNSK